MGRIDFKGLNAHAMGQARELLASWFPGGKAGSTEFTCADWNGGHGRSLSVNLNTGCWGEFAGKERGGDLISLLARQRNLKMVDAARELAKMTDFTMLENGSAYTPRSPEGPTPDPVLGPPPPEVQPPDFTFNGLKPTTIYPYTDEDGALAFYVARYEPPGQGKRIRPWSWAVEEYQWVMKGWKENVPLYGLVELKARPNAHVMVVEGEKCADAMRAFWPTYVVVTWMGGAGGICKADLKPLRNRKLLLWPDNDKPGREAMAYVRREMSSYCGQIKSLDPKDKPGGWDAADFIAEGGTLKDLRKWAVDNLVNHSKDRALVVPSQVVHASATPGSPTIIQSKGDTNVAFAVNQPTQDDAEASPSKIAYWESLGLILSANHTPSACVTNVEQIIIQTKALNGHIWFDTFHQGIFTDLGGIGVRPWKDSDDRMLMRHIHRDLEITRIGELMVHSGVQMYTDQRKRNEPLDWMDSIVWDGTQRIDDFMRLAYGAKNTPYIRDISRCFWTSIVARIYSPGCKVDNLIVLQGAQGVFKSTSLAAIGGRWYAETKESVRSNDFFQILNGKMLVEIADLASFQGADQTRLKSVITSSVDRYRPPYGRAADDFARQSIFVGTTNDTRPLKDPTGGRRYWPVKCGRINLEYIRGFRDQFFAEAVVRFKRVPIEASAAQRVEAGADWWNVHALEAKLEQEACREEDEWENIVGRYLKTVAGAGVTMEAIAKEALDIKMERLDMGVQRRLSNCLRRHGWENRIELERGATVRRWWPKRTEEEAANAAEPVPFIEAEF